MPKAVYTLAKEQKRRVWEWIFGLKFPNGYASNLARCIDMMELRMHGMKSHDCHVFMQKFIQIVIREILLEHVWSALAEVSLLFQSICLTTVDVHKLHELANDVVIILCNFEKKYSLAFFDSMEHLIVHLPYETRVGGPVQHMWMYPFEKFICELKKKVKNKVHFEASIVAAYIIEEISLFTPQYFELNVQSKRNMPHRNNESMSSDDGIHVSIFNYPGRASGAAKKRWLSGPEQQIIETYILTNCEVVTTYYELEKLSMSPSGLRHSHTSWRKCTVPVVTTNNQAYDLRDPNGLQVVVDLSMAQHHAVGTSRRQVHQNDDENEDEDEDSRDEETDDE
ncbi:UNVERIFIED_CONTAM: hypothetical protein Sangu_2767000 [Sesamum angustifolium]|uniref:DUF4218 domain-containing protein n=1 Tax=Sesamum angustifolium TaxID=2727405 RepID=A0AAW2IUJ1_9LAMI